MLDHFKNPPADYRVIPFWFWNSRLDPDEIERQIREMHDKGVGGFFIHGRFGLRTEYMGEDWMKCIELACELAQELGMHVYLYDENPFPSGVAGGEAMKSERNFNKFLDITRREVAAEEKIEIELPEGELLSAVAIDLNSPSEQIDLMPYSADGILTWTAPPQSKYEAITFTAATAKYQGFIYGSEPDYFEQSLVDTFFEFTHHRYAQRLQPYFGSVIKGIFTDEPKIQCIHHMHDDAYTSAWFADLPEQFEADHGYDLIPNLACLVADAGPQTANVRRDFWETVTRRYIERFFVPYHNWCEENGIKLTGHLFLEEGLYANTIYQGDFPRVLAQFDIPGADQLGLSAESQYSIPRIPGSITRTHGQKLASSVAHTRGLSRVLSETFGCAGWTLSLEHMKWIFDWQATLGINLLCPHAFYYSAAGVRKTDAPPSQFYQATYWPQYKLFADYAARVSYILSQGKHRAQIALLYPIKGFHSEWAPGAEGPLDTLVAESFDIYCSHLMKEHLDYDILDEESICRAMSLDQQLRLEGEAYDLLIMPPTTAIGYETALKIREFVEDGGAVIATSLLPKEDADGQKHEEVRQIFRELFGQDPQELYDRAKHQQMPAELEIESPEHGRWFVTGGGPTALAESLRDIVSRAIKPEVSVKWRGSECHDITCVHRSIEDKEVFFFSNNCDQAREVQITVRCAGSPHVLNAETGGISALPDCTQQGGRTILLHRFERYGSLLMYFTDEPAFAVTPPKAEEPRELELSDEWNFHICGPNSLTLRDWQMNISTHQEYMRYEYSTSFEATTIPDDLVLVLDDMPTVGAYAGCAGSSCKLFVNGSEITESAGWLIDVGFQALPISSAARPGTNTIKIVIDHGGWSGDPQPMLAECRLMGSFALDTGGTVLVPGHTSIRSGSWTEQGYPFYSGTGVYSQEVEIPEFLRSERVVIAAKDPADMVEFIINGAYAGVRAWAPFELDITPLVKPGINTVEIRVTNSIANALISKPRPSGLLKGVRLLIH